MINVTGNTQDKMIESIYQIDLNIARQNVPSFISNKIEYTSKIHSISFLTTVYISELFILNLNYEYFCDEIFRKIKLQ